MIGSLSRWISGAALLLWWGLLAAQVTVPPLTARVTDLTGTLTQPQQAALEQRLAAFESTKGSQIAVLMVATTQPEAIEQFGIRVAEQWKIGRKGVDDGAILIVALKDRALRIETGYGLEGALPDATANRIINEFIVPRFKTDEFYAGIDVGLTRMMSAIEGEPLPAPAPRRTSPNSGGGMENLLVIGFMLVFVVGGVLRAMFGRTLGSAIIGGIGGFAGWWLLSSLAAAVVVGALAGGLSLIGGGSGGMGGIGGTGVRRRGGWYGGGGHIGGGGWGGGGGGWGGGGGGFGGGGASGRW